MKSALVGVVGLWIACSSDRTQPPQAKSDPKAGSAVLAQAADAGGPLGALTFQLREGTPVARAHFQRGLLALHSFWYDEALRQFTAAIRADASMNMAYWGLALSHIKLLWGEDDVGLAKQALARMPDPDQLDDREQAWVMATIALLRAPDVRSSRRAFVQALEQLNAQYPDDETATFLAAALLSATRPEDPDHDAVRERAATLAGAVYARNPEHPGAAHYMIHAFDTPKLAPRALEVARAYAALAPAAFHAQHMPAHIFSRLGMWDESIASCRAAWEASLAAAATHKLSANHHDFHSLSWLVEMPFELGHQSEAARWLTLFGDAVSAGLGRQHRGLYITEVASYMRRSGEWTRVDELLAPLAAPHVEDATMPGAATSGMAVTPRVAEPAAHCASSPATSAADLAEQVAVLDTRALAAAMTRDRATTKRLVGELERTRARLRAALQPTQPAEILATFDLAHERRVQALLARAAGNDRALVRVLRAARDDARARPAGENNPSGFVIDEEIGDALLRIGDHKGALAAYSQALADHPRSARSLLGAARAAHASKDTVGARTRYAELLQLWSTAEPETDGLAEARAAVASR